ncbi:MAG: GLUG motif-containing protein, partial [Oscillospiraceae bacterium]
MKKRIGSLLLILALCFTLLPTAALASDGAWDGSIDTAFAGGTGTESDPYQIADGAQLAYLASEVNKGQPYENSYFVLTADIDLANHDWTPIGNSFSDALFGGTDYHLFAGNLDGKGHTIFNISIGTENAPLESDVFGLFGATGGKISNLNLDDITIYGTAKNVSGYIIGLAGALAGSASGPIENCHVANLSMTMNTPDSGTAAAYWIGGLVGALDGSQHIEECSASGTIKERSGKGSIGGLIGELGKAAKITYSHADVALDVKPDYYGGANVGGLIGKGNGENDPETVISNCYATGNVTGGAYSGGFAGSLWGLNIKNCYATGDVTGAFASMATFAGTDAPAAYAYGSVTNCYTTGKVVGTASSTYAFMQQDATARSPITNCYFADANSAIKNSNETAISKTPEEMQTEGFKDALNASSPTNGWIFREGETPLCGAEPADYSVVDAALGKIPADLTAYTDESIETLSAATEAVIRGKVIAKQAEVDTMAKAIEDAIAALVKKPSSSGGFSSGSFFPSYPVNTPDKTENGTVTVSTKNATSGSTVTITVKPDDGFKLDELTVIDKNGNELKLTDKGNGKYTFTMPASKVEVNAAFVKEVETSPFGDVSTSVYYYEAVKWAQEKGITGGI